MPRFKAIIDFSADVPDEQQMDYCETAITEGAAAIYGTATIISIDEIEDLNA